MFSTDQTQSSEEPRFSASSIIRRHRDDSVSFTAVDYILSALEMANISIPLTSTPVKMTGDDGWMRCGHHSSSHRQERL